ncbi:hypothetical protein [Amphibacillus cookii]|uniref:hypothetical protein n=1 Tax=Amphibacillus cookii TaxID=767787 RepID=UPI00195EF022|nr:hypothetical protein [Amphibacillus cookii]MBM7543062.1 N-acetylmuramoyl-L-alanine amidase [Amphibacillus cookii]
MKRKFISTLMAFIMVAVFSVVQLSTTSFAKAEVKPLDPGHGTIFSNPGDSVNDPGHGTIFSNPGESINDPGHGTIFSDPGHGTIF